MCRCCFSRVRLGGTTQSRCLAQDLPSTRTHTHTHIPKGWSHSWLASKQDDIDDADDDTDDDENESENEMDILVPSMPDTKEWHTKKYQEETVCEVVGPALFV